MLYFIGGAPRVGKSTLARTLMKREGIPFIPADVLTHALDESYPKLGIRKGKWEHIPSQFSHYLEKFAKHAAINQIDYCIEGDSFFPAQLAKLKKKLRIHVVFLGNSNPNLRDILKHEGYCNWVAHLPKKMREHVPDDIKRMSAMFEHECKKYHLAYIDLAKNRKHALARAYRILTK